MSPTGRGSAAKPVPKAREVKAEGGRGVVKITPNAKTVTVTWICGSHRRFTIEELRKYIWLADEPASKHPMWVNGADESKSTFWLRVTDGKLTANDGMRENGFVQWADLKRELQAMIAEILA